MRKAPVIACCVLLVLACGSVLAQEPLRAKTADGREVILSPDGTWKYVQVTAPKVVIEAPSPASAKKLYKPERGAFGIRYDESKWTFRPKVDEEGRAVFKLKRGDAYAMVIIEELGIPIKSLKKIALQNAQEAAPDARIVFEETRTVNGKEVLCLKLEGTIEEIPFSYYGYYYGGKQGTIQLITYTGTSLMPKYEDDFREFLNGLEIY